MTTRASVTSLEYYRLTITQSPDDDPTSLPVRFAFPVSGSAPTTWYAAQWETGGPPYVARLTIGPGGDVELETGTYDVYAEVTDSPEIVRFLADLLVVFDETTSFASVAELADMLGADIDPEDPQANQALRDATNFIRAYTGQTLTFVEGDVVELDGQQRTGLILPQVPVVAVNSVTTLDPVGTETLLDVVSYRIDRAGILWRMDGWAWGWGWAAWGYGHANVVVDYDHGYEVLPDDLHTACLEIAASNYVGAVSRAGNVESESIGSYSVTYGVASNTSSSGAQNIPATWKVILDHYRVPK